MGRDLEREIGVYGSEGFTEEGSLLNAVLDQGVSPVIEGAEAIGGELTDLLERNVEDVVLVGRQHGIFEIVHRSDL